MTVNKAWNQGWWTQWEIFFDDEILPIKRTDIQNMLKSEIDSRYNYIIELYKNYFMYNRDRQKQLEKDWDEWRTNIKSPLTYQYANAAYWLFLDSDVRFVAMDVNWKYDVDDNTWKSVTDEMVELADYFYSNWQVRDEFLSQVFDTILLWYWYSKDSFLYKENVIHYKDKNLQPKSVNVKQELPTVEYVSPFSLFFPPNTKKLSDARFIIERKLMPAASIEEKYWYLWLQLDEDYVERYWEYISYKDYEAVKVNLPFYNNAEGTNILEDDTFNIKNKFLEVIEVNTKEHTSIFINWVYHWSWRKSLIYDDYPYYLFNFKKIPWVSHSIWVGYVVKPLQQVYDEILNSRQDNVKLSQNKMIFVDPKVDMFGKWDVWKIKPWKVYKVSDPQRNIMPFELGWPWQSEYHEIDALFEMIEAAIGISWPMLWTQRKVERSATWAELLKNAAVKQMKPLLDSVSNEFARIMKHWIVNALVYMDRDTFDKILWEDNKLKDLDVADVINDFDFRFEMTSMKSQSLSVEREQLMQLIQMSNTFVAPDGRQLIDMQKVLDRLLETFNFDNNLKLSKEEFADRLSATQEAKQEAQEQLQEWQNPKNDSQQRMSNLQRQAWWGWVPPEQSSNPEWSNLPSNSEK